ncbi:hypothetical protein GCM10011504_30780 [Siccirubricoccus deserti]|uniref:Uncharacterized protein n=1 Tax=Siccirubricoccus deserti TaxID=2013562 RepID=A0A9X0QZ93_9PROT|nr:hypothetical protein [Siccirubricoccus deserti]MBC4016579.1 hypothetical protein [Siccirubricoccus deserti]GGC50192.1 hypothetical protein GCM10011504_30780 [Siccirubricoccus deserti]
MTVPIANDFAAIRARMQEIRAAEQPCATQPAERPATPAPLPDNRPHYADFYGWLMGGGLWTPG